MAIQCFDKKTHTDCPRRHSGCAMNCPDWAKYVAERDKEYERRAKINEQKMMLDATREKRTASKLRRVIENRAA